MTEVSKLVRVKPLEWEYCLGEFVTNSLIARYIIEPGNGGDWWVNLCGYYVAEGVDIDAAKAAAQADFERRILACITTRMESE